jgi:quercetin dioxygenase-like cupin family protein
MKKILLLIALPLLMASCATKKDAAIGNFHHLTSRNMTNISSMHEAAKAVSAKPLFKGQEGTVNALQIQKDGLLDKHITKVPALLVCVAGEVVFENETGFKQTLTNGDYINIEPMVTHWVKGIQDSQLLLIK